MSENTFKKEVVHAALESFTNWGNSGVQYVAKAYGDRAAVEYLRECGYALVRPVVENAGKEGEKVIDGLEMFHRLMGSQVKVEEDEESKRLVVVNCASGDRMKRQGLITQRRKDNTPYYCYHCTLWWEEMLKEAGFNFAFHYSEDGPCIYEYKKR
ncbi:MAG: hypothetical protein JRJ26_07290 [Deltaproteobacteria bacterium]|nr:hypothetical protein [Deltaproteobacteria bacterium]